MNPHARTQHLGLTQIAASELPDGGLEDKLGMGIWGEEAYRRIAEIGAKDL